MNKFSFSDLELQQLNLDEVLPDNNVRKLYSPLVEKHNEYIKQKNLRFAHLFDLLAVVVLLPFHPDQKEVFGNPEQLSSRLFNSGQLADTDAEILKSILGNISNAALKSRIDANSEKI